MFLGLRWRMGLGFWCDFVRFVCLFSFFFSFTIYCFFFFWKMIRKYTYMYIQVGMYIHMRYLWASRVSSRVHISFLLIVRVEMFTGKQG